MRPPRKLQAIIEKKKRTLHVSLPHTIRDKEDVAKLFTGDFTVKLPRQRTRHCYVVFPNVKEKIRNLHAVKDIIINGKPVVASSVHASIQRGTKLTKKKIVMPKIQKQPKVTQALYVSNIKCGTKLQELKEAFVGCRSAKLLKPYSQDFRSAIIKMENIHIAAEYLSKVRESPVIRGHRVIVKSDTRQKHTNHKKRKNVPLKIYNGNSDEEDELSDDAESEEEM